MMISWWSVVDNNMGSSAAGVWHHNMDVCAVPFRIDVKRQQYQVHLMPILNICRRVNAKPGHSHPNYNCIRSVHAGIEADCLALTASEPTVYRSDPTVTHLSTSCWLIGIGQPQLESTYTVRIV